MQTKIKKIITKKQKIYLDKKNILNVNNLSVSVYDQNKCLYQIINNLSLNVKHSEIVAVVGESGSGKTISFKALLNLDSNLISNLKSAKLNNTNFPKKNDLKKWKEIWGKKIVYIPQELAASLNPSRKIKNMFLDILKNMKQFKNKKWRIEYVKNILKDLELEHVEQILNSYPFKLSGGEKQRISIALAIIQKPQIIVADEPTSALDYISQNSVLRLFKKIQTKYQSSIIFISHDLLAVAKICDYVYILKDGNFVEFGLVEEIFINPKHNYTYQLISLATTFCSHQNYHLTKIQFNQNKTRLINRKDSKKLELKKISPTHYVLDLENQYSYLKNNPKLNLKNYLKILEARYEHE